MPPLAVSQPDADIVAALSWPDLLQVLFTLSQAPDVGKRETAFRVFKTTPGIIEKQHEDAVAQAFAAAFKDDSVAVWASHLVRRGSGY